MSSTSTPEHSTGIDRPDQLQHLAAALSERLKGANVALPIRDEARRLLSRLDGLGAVWNRAQRDLAKQLQRFAFQRGWLDLLKASGVPHVYDYWRGYDENLSDPPGVEPSPIEKVGPHWRLLGKEVDYPIGVAASPLTANSDWINFFARSGFNVLTYKTVRSVSWPAHPLPNWIFLDEPNEPIPPGSIPADLVARGESRSYPDNVRAYSMANSFGVPSRPTLDWQRDVAKTLELLGPGQLLIVSVIGTAEELSGDDLVHDFVRVSRLAEEAGATAIELNLSCPNTLSQSRGEWIPPVSESADDAARIVQAVREELASQETQLVAKLGYMPMEHMGDVLENLVDSVAGISGINTWPMTVCDGAGAPVFKGSAHDPAVDRRVAGVSGVAIRDLALNFVSSLAALRRDNAWTFDIIGMGGVMAGHDVRALMASGADAAQSVTAAANNPRLAQEVLSASQREPGKLLEQLRKAIAESGWTYRTSEGLARELGLDPVLIERMLAEHPDIARPSPLQDRQGRSTWTSPDRGASVEERLAAMRKTLARE